MVRDHTVEVAGISFRPAYRPFSPRRESVAHAMRSRYAIISDDSEIRTDTLAHLCKGNEIGVLDGFLEVNAHHPPGSCLLAPDDVGEQVQWRQAL
jgi:hypothetical protein